MNVVRSAGGGGGGGQGNGYKFEENSAATQHARRPISSISELMKKTNFTKDEIRHLYRTFKQDCPSGEVTRTHFATVFSMMFPGGESFHYSTFVFRNIDRANTGYIRFEDLIGTLSILVHGSLEDRLSWAFDLYDLNKDGMLTRAEVSQIVASIFQLVVPVNKLNFASISQAIAERTDQLFQNWDTRGDGYVQKEDFIRYCLQSAWIEHASSNLMSRLQSLEK